MGEPTVNRATTFRTGSSFTLPDVIRSLGYSPEAVFSAAGIDPKLYHDPENRITGQDLGRLFECAARVTSRSDIALVVASSFQPKSLGLVGLLAAEGPDVDTALRNVARLLQYNTLAGYPVLANTAASAMMKFELRYADFAGANFILDAAVGIIFRFIQGLCGDSWNPEEVRLSRREPSDSRSFYEFFGGSIRFSATEDGVLFSSRWLNRPVAREKYALQSRTLEDAGAPFSELVRRQLARDLGFVSLTGAALASRLGVSRRELFRRLSAEGTTCHRLVEDLRLSRARHLLAAGDAPIAEIAFAVGYPDQSSFTRAFSRRSGTAPGEWRRRGREDR
jgi:AraC-like DNA-binding protein